MSSRQASKGLAVGDLEGSADKWLRFLQSFDDSLELEIEKHRWAGHRRERAKVADSTELPRTLRGQDRGGSENPGAEWRQVRLGIQQRLRY